MEYIGEMTNECLVDKEEIAEKVQAGTLRSDDLRKYKPDEYDLSLKHIVRNKEVYLLGSLKRQVSIQSEKLEMKEQEIEELKANQKVVAYHTLQVDCESVRTEKEELARKLKSCNERRELCSSK